MKPIKVRLQNCDVQIGIERDPMICWEYEVNYGGMYQKRCRILVVKHNEVVYDSGWMNTKKQNNHIIKPLLNSHQCYHIVVEAEDEYGKVERSEKVGFITGICKEDEWVGNWISSGSGKPHCLGKNINIEKNIKAAYISVTGVGQYEMLVNGLELDNSVLNGSWTDYNKHIHYRTYDATSFLHSGLNNIIIELGNGWYLADQIDNRHHYTLDKGYKAFGKCLAAIATISLEYEDGSIERIGSDNSWFVKSSGTIYSNIYGSEDYDARIVADDGDRDIKSIELSKEDAPKGKKVPLLYPPVRVKEIYNGKRIKEYTNTGVLYDFGQNMSALFEICIRGERGQVVKLTPVEKLDKYGDPQRTTDSWSYYTIGTSNKAETWKSKFTYGAGRYLLIELYDYEKSSSLPIIEYVRGHFITSSAKDSSCFYSSDTRLNQVHDMIIKSIESNLNHVHTDCPTIERLGWQEPNHLMGPSVMYTKNVETLWTKILKDQCDSQYEADEFDIDIGNLVHEYKAGLLPSIAPRYAKFTQDWGNGSFWDIIPWGSSILLAAYEQYRFYGNKESLVDNYPVSKKYVDYLYSKYTSYNQIYNKSGDVKFLCHGLGDWGAYLENGLSRENIETAYLYRDLVLLYTIAEWIGAEKDYVYYKNIAEQVLNDYNRILLTQDELDGEWYYQAYDRDDNMITQANQAIAIQFNMVPLEYMESVKRSFLKSTACGSIQSGEVGLPYIFRTLGDLEQVDRVYEMIMQENHPSYYRFIQKGETTLPEFWRDDARSRNHDMMGSVLEWYYRYLAGISSEDGYQTINIKPNIPSHMDELRCTYISIVGKIEVHIQRIIGEGLKMKINIPTNTKGLVKFSNMMYDIEGGIRYEF